MTWTDVTTRLPTADTNHAACSGTQDLVVAGGVEVMSLVPIMSSSTVGTEQGLGDPFASEGFTARYEGEVSQFLGACLLGVLEQAQHLGADPDRQHQPVGVTADQPGNTWNIAFATNVVMLQLATELRAPAPCRAPAAGRCRARSARRTPSPAA